MGAVCPAAQVLGALSAPPHCQAMGAQAELRAPAPATPSPRGLSSSRAVSGLGGVEEGWGAGHSCSKFVQKTEAGRGPRVGARGWAGRSGSFLTARAAARRVPSPPSHLPAASFPPNHGRPLPRHLLATRPGLLRGLIARAFPLAGCAAEVLLKPAERHPCSFCESQCSGHQHLWRRFSASVSACFAFEWDLEFSRGD